LGKRDNKGWEKETVKIRKRDSKDWEKETVKIGKKRQ
jgi:hypothetical protein